MNIQQLRKYFYAIAVLIPLICAISFVQTKINTIKIEEKLTDTTIIKNAPPLVAFVTVVMGSFRGLLADILWLRTIALQDEGKYYEMVQLASWITKLQPRFTGATAYLAWNMAYNISVTCSSHEDRWRWVQKGIELIRDEALEYNPADPVLYKELGWIYQHKIGNIMDDANQYYKNRMATGLMEVFGKADADWEALAAAPKNEKELKETLVLDDQFWKDLATPGIDFRDKYYSFSDIEKDFKLFGKIPLKVQKAMHNDNDSIQFLDNYYRAKWLREKYKLDPETIIKLNKKYGRLDWRLPEAHAIYWATKGIENDVKGEVNVHCDRMITQSIKDAFMGGKLIIADKNNPRSFMAIPNIEIADAAIDAYKKAYKRQDSKSFNDGMRNFMKDIVVIMYTFGKYSKAKKFFKMLQKENPTNKSLRRMGLDKFVMKEWKEDARDATVKQAMDLISGLIYRSCFMAAGGEQDSAIGHLNLAKSIYNMYHKEHESTWERVGLPPFDELKNNITQVFKSNMGKSIDSKIIIKPEKKTKVNP
jgi:tetratricopeptide (TPR) repeat protein